MTSRSPFSALHVTLYLVALLLACGCVVGGVLVVKHHDDGDSDASLVSAASADVEARYGEVKQAAAATARALVNISFRDPQASLDRVATTATGTFLKQYRASSNGLVRLVKTYRAVLSGTVTQTAVSDVDDDSATVLVATHGKIRNTATATSSPQVREFRLLIKLVKTDDGWRANDLEFVG